MEIWLICSGLLVALAGSWFLATTPVMEAIHVASGWGGGTPEQWDRIKKQFRQKMIYGLALLVFGTLLQILGTAPNLWR